MSTTLEKALPKPKIELYSGKYFLACGVGGIIGMLLSAFPCFLRNPTCRQ